MTIDPKAGEFQTYDFLSVEELRAEVERIAVDVFLWQPSDDPHSWDALMAKQARARKALLSAVRTAHLHELRGETEEETWEKAVMAVALDRDEKGEPVGRDTDKGVLAEIDADLQAAAPILTAPLRAKLQQAVAAEREKYAPLVKAHREWVTACIVESYKGVATLELKQATAALYAIEPPEG